MYVHSYLKYTRTRNLKITMAFKMLITADYHQDNKSIFLICQEGGNVLKTVLYS